MPFSQTASNNVAIGPSALSFNNTGENNIGIGSNAINDNKVGSGNVAFGVNALTKATGSSNTAIGHEACQYVTGSNKTCVGANSGPSSTSAYVSDTSQKVYIGEKSSKVIIPGDLMVMGNIWFHARPTNATDKFEIGRISWDGGDSDRLRLVNKMTCPSWYSECEPNTYWSYASMYYDYSDKRLKNIKSENKSGLEELRNLKVYDYTFKKDKAKTPQVGVMAQDLQKVFPNAVKKGDDGFLMIRRDEMFYAMLNSIKQLDTLVQGLISEVKMILIKITTHDEEIKKLRKENAELKTRLEKLEKAVF